jgi:flagellar hook-associated protein 2
VTSFNISGLVSGIDTTSLVTQLMTVAAKPQTMLKSQLSTQNSVSAAYTSINAKMAAVQAAADALTNGATSGTAWSAATAVSSDASVVAASGAGGQAGSSTTFSVRQVATAQVTTVAAGGSAIADPGAGIDVVDGAGLTHHIDLASGSAAGVVAAVNSAAVGVRAAVINTDGGSLVQFTSTSTGVSSAFTISGLSAPAQTLTAARDAQISVGDLDGGGYTVSSSSNTFTDAIPGVTFTVSKPATDVTISVSTDQEGINGSVGALVTAVNAALTEISTDTAKGALLSGDSTLRDLKQQLLTAVSSGAVGASYADYGINLKTDGALEFDAAVFAKSYVANTATTQSTIGTLATAFSAIAKATTDASTGTLTQLISGGATKVDDLTKQIASWDVRLADQQVTLQAKYTAMETAISRLKSQSAYLSSMFASMNSSSSSSSSSS